MLVSVAAEFSGPLPPPELLGRYNDVLPGGAERIVALAEQQAAHRMQIEKIVIGGDARRADRGLLSAVSITLSFLIVSAILVMTGHDVAGTILGTVDLVALASVFIYGTRSRKDERIRKARIMTSRSMEDH